MRYPLMSELDSQQHTHPLHILRTFHHILSKSESSTPEDMTILIVLITLIQCVFCPQLLRIPSEVLDKVGVR